MEDISARCTGKTALESRWGILEPISACAHDTVGQEPEVLFEPESTAEPARAARVAPEHHVLTAKVVVRLHHLDRNRAATSPDHRSSAGVDTVDRVARAAAAPLTLEMQPILPALPRVDRMYFRNARSGDAAHRRWGDRAQRPEHRLHHRRGRVRHSRVAGGRMPRVHESPVGKAHLDRTPEPLIERNTAETAAQRVRRGGDTL